MSKAKILTREDILKIPDAPVGQRACDFPEEDKAFAEQFLKARELLHKAARKLIGDGAEDRPDFWRRALEVLKVTGFQPRDYNLLNITDELKVTQAAAKMTTRQKAELQKSLTRAVIEAKRLEQSQTGDKPSDKARDEAAPPKADTAKNVSAEATAIAILIDNPEWDNTRIAKEAGIYRTTLYDFPKFMEARRLQKEEGKKSLPGGSKDGETGTMEAWER